MDVYKETTTMTHRHTTQTQIRRTTRWGDKQALGTPLSAQLFAIYGDAMLQEYDNALHGEIKQTQQETYERNEFGEHKVTTHLRRY